MILQELVKPESVLCNAEARSKKHALEILSELLSRGDEKLRQQEIFSALTERERLGCTALGRAAAAPHARYAHAPYPIGALLKLSSPIDFDTADDEPVDLIFGLIVPEDAGEEINRDFCEITEMLFEHDTQARLREARSSRQLFDLLMAEAGQPAPPGADDVARAEV